MNCEVKKCNCKVEFESPAFLCETHWCLWWFADGNDDDDIDVILEGNVLPLDDQEYHDGDEHALRQYLLAKEFINKNYVVHYLDVCKKEDSKCPEGNATSFLVNRVNPIHKWSNIERHVNCKKCLKLLRETNENIITN